MSLVHALAMLAVFVLPAAARAADWAPQVVGTNGGSIARHTAGVRGVAVARSLVGFRETRAARSASALAAGLTLADPQVPDSPVRVR